MKSFCYLHSTFCFWITLTLHLPLSKLFVCVCVCVFGNLLYLAIKASSYVHNYALDDEIILYLYNMKFIQNNVSDEGRDRHYH